VTGDVRVVKGTVQVTGDLTPDIVRILTTRHRARTEVEIWRARIDTLDTLAELEAIDRLALVNCRLADPASLSRMPTLRRLFLNELTPAGGWAFLAGVTQLDELELLNIRGPLALPSFAEHRTLTRIHVWGCRGLDDAAALASAPALTELACVDTGLDLDSLAPLLAHPTLRYLDVGLRTARANAELDELLAAHGKQRHRAA
jgi:hypothetical protein